MVKKSTGPIGSGKSIEEQQALTKDESEKSPPPPSIEDDFLSGINLDLPEAPKEAGSQEPSLSLIDALPEARPSDNFLSKRDPLLPREDPLRDKQGEELLQKALSDTGGQPIAERLIKEVVIADLSLAEQTELAIQCHEVLGKAAGYLPDFASITENMKAAHLKCIQLIWVAAQRKARTFNE